MDQILLATAHTLGVSITTIDTPHAPAGYYSPASNTIYIRSDLPYRVERSIIAHELGHARYGHNCSSPKAERQANRYAAVLLIDPTTYQQLERYYGTNINKLAYELDVTPSLIIAFQDALNVTRAA